MQPSVHYCDTHDNTTPRYAIRGSDVVTMAQNNRLRPIWDLVLAPMLEHESVDLDTNVDGVGMIVRKGIDKEQLLAVRTLLIQSGAVRAPEFRIYEEGPHGGWHKLRECRHH